LRAQTSARLPPAILAEVPMRLIGLAVVLILSMIPPWPGLS
jgi:hypothetical protein